MTGLNLTTAFPISVITTSATSWLNIFAPYLELILGVLLAFLIVRYIVNAIKGTHINGDDYENDIYP